MREVNQQDYLLESNTPGLTQRQAVVMGGIILALVGAFSAWVGHSQMTEFDEKPRDTPVTRVILGREVRSDYGTLHDSGEDVLWVGGAMIISGTGMIAGSRFVLRPPKRPDLHIVE